MKSQDTLFLEQDKELYKYLHVYLLLLIFEGVFRKWIRLSNQDIFYFLRDLLVVLVILKLVFSSRFKNSSDHNIRFGLNIIFLFFSIYAFIAIAIQSIPAQVVLFGFRNYTSIFMLVYLCSYIRDKSRIFDKIYKAFLLALFFQLPIVVLQVSSGPNSFVNKTGWEIGATVFTSGEVVRPTGTFTNALGLGYYLLIVFGLLLSAHLKGFTTQKSANLNSLALFMLLIISAISGSRTVLLGLSLTALLFVFVSIKRLFQNNGGIKHTGKSSRLLLLFMYTSLVFILYKLVPVINAFIFRLNYQTEGNSGTRSRVLNSIFGYQYSDLTLIGTGMGTRHQSALALGWIQPWVENETLRWSAELGLFGFTLIILRQIWILSLAASVLIRNVEYRNLSPMIFISMGPFLVSGISTQPTIQGMSAVMMLMLVFRNRI